MTPEYMLEIFMRGTFFLLLLFFAIYSTILTYHWFTYGNNRHFTRFAITGYFMGGILCFLVMGLSIL